MCREGEDIGGIGKEGSRWGGRGEAVARSIGRDDSQVEGERCVVEQGSFEAGGGKAVQVEDGRVRAGRGAVFGPCERALVGKHDGFGFCGHFLDS